MRKCHPIYTQMSSCHYCNTQQSKMSLLCCMKPLAYGICIPFLPFNFTLSYMPENSVSQFTRSPLPSRIVSITNSAWQLGQGEQRNRQGNRGSVSYITFCFTDLKTPLNMPYTYQQQRETNSCVSSQCPVPFLL